MARTSYILGIAEFFTLEMEINMTAEVQVCQNVGLPNTRLPNLVIVIITILTFL